MLAIVTRIGVICILLFAFGCSGPESHTLPTNIAEHSSLMPPIAFTEDDLIGRWETIFLKYSVETLIINKDYSFTQIYETTSPNQRYEGQGSWWMEQRESGCTYLHLEGMRYFYGGEALERNGNRLEAENDPYPFWERCESQYILMPDKVILSVGTHPRFPRGIDLLFPATSSTPSSSISMRLVVE